MIGGAAVAHLSTGMLALWVSGVCKRCGTGACRTGRPRRALTAATPALAAAPRAAAPLRAAPPLRTPPSFFKRHHRPWAGLAVPATPRLPRAAPRPLLLYSALWAVAAPHLRSPQCRRACGPPPVLSFKLPGVATLPPPPAAAAGQPPPPAARPTHPVPSLPLTVTVSAGVPIPSGSAELLSIPLPRSASRPSPPPNRSFSHLLPHTDARTARA